MWDSTNIDSEKSTTCVEIVLTIIILIAGVWAALEMEWILIWLGLKG
jgi:hypothetical protein